MEAMQIGARLVDLCREGKNREAIEELYADTVNVQEAMERPGNPNGPRSRDQILKESDEFFEMMEIKDGGIEGPFPYADGFIAYMYLDAIPRHGPMAGQRIMMREACVYKVADGKIAESHFCYDMPTGES